MSSDTNVNARHQAISGLFLGPRAENASQFKDLINYVIDGHISRRQLFQPNDSPSITSNMQSSKAFQGSLRRLRESLKLVSEGINDNTVPFWSPRYTSHMVHEPCMPAIMGYLTGMLCNQNNIIAEASPFTTLLESEVGMDLCRLVGFQTLGDAPQTQENVAWGHITSGGTVANLESLWVARNLKFYPLSLRWAIDENALPTEVATNFQVETCDGEKKLFQSLTPWELQNLKPETILDIPKRFRDEFFITSTFLDNVMDRYSIQTIGRGALEAKFNIIKPAQVMVSSTRHYCWPKGSAVLRIGSGNLKNIPIDNQARIDMVALEKQLRDCLKDQQAVYTVVAVTGSTEEGSVDPVEDIVKLRETLQAEGMSFLIHVDAAWGGYFKTMVPPLGVPYKGPIDEQEYVGALRLRDHTETHLRAMTHVNSVTLDPHKTGYIPYPAGALCYRDERMRFLVTGSSPYISGAGMGDIGIYGIEGSKPGVAASATYVAHCSIQLNESGYGSLLSEAISAYFATMETGTFVVVPFNMLPIEDRKAVKRYGSSEAVEAQREYISKNILDKENWDLSKDEKAMELLREIGSEMVINSFACNFKDKDGKWNEDVKKQTFTMHFFISSTEFYHSQYEKCTEDYKTRLGLDFMSRRELPQDLYILRNVLTWPFLTFQRTILKEVMAEFERVAEEQAKVRQERNRPDLPDIQRFIMQGTDILHLVHQHLFHMAGHRKQLIVTADIPSGHMDSYVKARNEDTENRTIILVSDEPVAMINVAEGKSFMARVQWLGKERDETLINAKGVQVTLTRIIKRRPLNHKFLDASFELAFTPFYLYGTPAQMHADHMLLSSPSTQISVNGVSFEEVGKTLDKDLLERGLLAFVLNARRTMDLDLNKEFFNSRNCFKVLIYIDPNEVNVEGPGLAQVGDAKPIAEGNMILGGSVFFDLRVNQTPVPEPDIRPFSYPGEPEKQTWRE